MAKRKADAAAAENDGSDAAPAGDAPPVKRSRGRPKGTGKPKKPVDPDAPKRPRGRPRINAPKDPNSPKKPRGRPPAVTSSPKKKSTPKGKVTSRSSTPGKRGRPAGSKNKNKKPARKPQEEEAEQSDE
ncbi:high mobility group protein HMGI-C-like [Patiria miniata]|uniref:Uncharacterized protein n=1 Tax=Patiria miniata TaxID=46514 RepID=A0A913Z160_PATMI|nr:high mobility group protein HMGI-C-like [Patiria miniata]XP_038045635.1 high mobility group protein HMGI-C-like [Patiria miniata]